MTLRTRDKAALGVVAVLAAVVAFYFVVLGPQISKVSSLDAQIAAEHTALAEDEATYHAGKAAQISLRVGGAQWAALQRALPVRSNIPALLRTLQRSSQNAHVKMQTIGLSGTSAESPETSTTTNPGAATAVPVALSFSGSYQALEKFTQELNGLVTQSGRRVRAGGPVVSVGSVALTSSDPGLQAELTASIYQLATPTPSATGVTP